MLKKKKEILEKNNILKNNIDKLKIIIQELIKKLNIVLDNIEKYYEINKYIIVILIIKIEIMKCYLI